MRNALDAVVRAVCPETRRPAGAVGLLLTVVLGFAGLQGCVDLPRNPVPKDLIESVEIPGMPNVRFWGDESSPAMTKVIESSIELQRRYLASRGVDALGDTHMLAISGGGADGAFGAGFLCGWTAAGTRPTFGTVTGISTGALIAPFAFLGSDFDDFLREMYTTVTTRDIVRRRALITGIFSDAMADADPLREILDKHINREFLDRVAAEYAKGRRLIIGTTDMDSQRPVIWSMGTIASSKDPKAIQLFREVMLASASIPAIFPPVMIDVEADGKKYDEMHVDGGVTTQVFLYPAAFSMQSLSNAEAAKRQRYLYILRNGRLGPTHEEIDRRLLPIAIRSLGTLTKAQGLGDLHRIYLGSKRDGLDFNLAVIPDSFQEPSSEPFDSVYMRALFDLGFALAKGGYDWAKAPPGFEPPPLPPNQ